MSSLGGGCLSYFFIALTQHPGKSNLKGKRLLSAYISLMAGKTEQQAERSEGDELALSSASVKSLSAL